MINKKKLLAGLGVLVLVVGAAVATYALVLNKQDAASLYREAVANALATTAEEPYGALTIETENIDLNGEFKGLVTGGDGSGKFEFKTESSFDGIPVKLSAEMLSLTENDKDNTYFRYRSISTDNEQFSGLLNEYFEPVINVWTKAPDTEDEEDATSFEDDGPLAVVSLLGMYAPITNSSEKDQQTYLSLMDKYDLYQVGETVEETTFKGTDARKLQVSIKKEALLAFEKEAVQQLSEDEDYEQLSEEFVDQAFGESGILRADVYLSPDEAVITGVYLETELSEEVQENAFETKMREISSSLLIDYDRDFKVEAPTDAVSEEAFSQLLSQ